MLNGRSVPRSSKEAPLLVQVLTIRSNSASLGWHTSGRYRAVLQTLTRSYRPSRAVHDTIAAQTYAESSGITPLERYIQTTGRARRRSQLVAWGYEIESNGRRVLANLKTAKELAAMQASRCCQRVIQSLTSCHKCALLSPGTCLPRPGAYLVHIMPVPSIHTIQALLFPRHGCNDVSATSNTCANSSSKATAKGCHCLNAVG
jgi:hypothetical protein